MARWLAVVAWAIAIFVIGLPFCTDTFYIEWDLPNLALLAWVLAVVSFVIHRTILAGILFFSGLIFILLLTSCALAASFQS
ncbi:MAG TPA: hypothetical protein VKU37_01840 [Verrucomicrobiae bacterium]|nr:hypothetical protein [Verrucomicrobiae bacterium]